MIRTCVPLGNRNRRDLDHLGHRKHIFFLNNLSVKPRSIHVSVLTLGKYSSSKQLFEDEWYSFATYHNNLKTYKQIPRMAGPTKFICPEFHIWHAPLFYLFDLMKETLGRQYFSGDEMKWQIAHG